MQTRPEEYKDQLSQIIAYSFADVFSPDSYDPALDTFNYEAIPDDARAYVKAYRRNLLIQITTFLGVPNTFALNEKIAGQRILTNLFDWQPHKTKRRKAINIGLGTLFFAKNVIIIACSIILNSCKLLTEFLPVLAARGFRILAEHAYKNGLEGAKKIANGDNSFFWKCMKIAGYGILIVSSALLMLFAITFKSIQVIGRTITSPIDSVRIAYYYPVNLDPTEGKFFGKLAGVLLAIASIFITITAYSFLFPLIISTAPASIGSLLTQFMNAFYWMDSFFVYMGAHIMLPNLANLGFLTALVNCGISLTPVMAGFTTVLGLFLTIPGSMAKSSLDFFRWKWRITDERGVITKTAKDKPEITLTEQDTRAFVNEVLQKAQTAKDQTNDAAKDVSNTVERLDKKARKRAHKTEKELKKAVDFEGNKKKVVQAVKDGPKKVGEAVTEGEKVVRHKKRDAEKAAEQTGKKIHRAKKEVGREYHEFTTEARKSLQASNDASATKERKSHHHKRRHHG